ncbi:MAG: glycosyltransferase family 87 protein [Chloroflexota bacterium]|jgi:alpha-1,2-mannosyltransferase|nr:glycosyltransferase family 87 protein [Chloroflexota bacterium]
MLARRRLERIGAVLGWLSVPATGAALATLIVGRTLLFWPGRDWLLAFVVATLLIAAVWLAVECWRGVTTRESWWRSGLPLLLLADAWLVLGFAYLDETTNHLLSADLLPGGLIVEPDLQGYLELKFVVLVVGRLLLWWWDGAGGEQPDSEEPAGSDALWIVAVVVLAGLYIRMNVLDVLAIETPSDFRVNYVAALALGEGLNPYDNAVALAVAGREGIPYVGTETWAVVTNPPTAMSYFYLFTGMGFDAARVAFLWVNQALLLLTGLVLWAIARPARPWRWLAFVLALAVAFEPLAATLRLGQVDVVVALLLSAAVLAGWRGMGFVAGAAVGVAAGFKLAPALLVLYFLWRREWRAVGGLAAGGLAALAVSLLLVGTETWNYYLAERLPDLLAGTGLWDNLALPGLVSRYALGTSQAQVYWGTLPAMPLATSLGYFAAAAVLLLTGPALRARRSRALEFGVATAAVLLIAGVAWPHYALWLLPALAWLGAGWSWPRNGRRRLIAGGLLGAGLALISLPLPAYENLFGGLYAASVTAMSLRNLGLLAVFGALALLARSPESDPLESDP